jgi:hypothetical protein
MKYENYQYRARYEQALKATQNLARVARYRLDREPAILPPELADALCAPEAYLIFLPSGGDYPFKLEKAVRETLSTVLLVEPGSTTQGTLTFYFTLLRHSDDKTQWHRAMRLWIDSEQRLFLIPDPDGEEPQDICFRIEHGVRPSQLPYSHEIERDFGLSQADALLLEP